MPPKDAPSQKNNLFSYFSRTPSQPSHNAAFASSPAAPTTIQETPTTHLTTFLHDNTLAGNAFSSLSSPIASCSPLPTAPRGIATYDGIAEYRTPSLPQSSGNSTNASKRTFSGGIPVVLNSDSDSDSLTDLDELLNHEPIGKPKAVTRVATAGREEDSTRSGLPRPPKRLKDDKAFKRLVQGARKNAEMEQNIAKAQAELDKPLREHSLKHDLQISEEMVAGALHDEDDPEKAKKLYLAMQRTNAFQVDCAFHFFDRESDDDSAFHLPFPLESLSHPRMASKFEDDSSRDQAFLSGFARLLFGRDLPEELADWMIQEVCMGTNEALGQRYLEILSTSQHHLTKILDVKRLGAIFVGLGAHKQFIDSDSEVTPSYGPDPGQSRVLPRAIINVCKLLQLSSPQLRAGARIKILKILFLICMDDEVQMDNAVLHTLQDAIESLICPIPSTGEIASILDIIISDVLLRVKHPILQRNLVTALPTRYPLTASIQRYLALSFLLHPTKIDHPLTSPETLNIIHDHLQNSPSLRIKKDTDYAILAAHFRLLDVAIGPGPLTVPFQSITSPPTSQDSQGLELIEEIKPTSGEVNAFNREVDALAQQIRLIGNGIHVAGAITDLSRLAASDACDRLCTRLEHVVRIGGRKVKNIFGKNEDEDEGSKTTFRKWLGRSKPQSRSLGEMLAGDDARDGVALENDGEERNAERVSDSAAIKNEHTGDDNFTDVDMSVRSNRNV